MIIMMIMIMIGLYIPTLLAGGYFVESLAPPMMVWNPFKSIKTSSQPSKSPVDKVIAPGDVIWTPGSGTTHDFDFAPFGIEEMGGYIEERF